MKSKTIIIFSGLDPNPLTYETLTNRKATVYPAYCYQRAQPAPLPPSEIQQLQSVVVDYIICTSMALLTNLIDLLKEHRQWLISIRIIVINEEMVLIAKEFGFSSIHLIDNVCENTIIEFIKNHSN